MQAGTKLSLTIIQIIYVFTNDLFNIVINMYWKTKGNVFKKLTLQNIQAGKKFLFPISGTFK